MWRRRNGGRGAKEKKKCGARTHGAQLDQHHISARTLGAGCNQSRQHRQRSRTIKRRLTNTHTALGACRHDRGAWPRNQPTHKVVPFYKYNNQTRTQAIEYAYMKSASIRHYHILDSRHPPTTSALRKFEKVYIHPSQASLATRNFGKSSHVNIDVL